MRPSAIHHVSINVTDLNTALLFYTERLGLTVRTDRPANLGGGTWLDAGGEQLHLIVGDVPSAHGQHFALLVDELDASVAELREAGTPVSDPIPVGTARQAFLTDPDGNTIELHEPATSAADDRGRRELRNTHSTELSSSQSRGQDTRITEH